MLLWIYNILLAFLLIILIKTIKVKKKKIKKKIIFLDILSIAVTYCSTPPAIQNGILKSATGGKVGDNATYECNGGFTLGGSATIQCQKNGMWENQPSCNGK